MIRSLTTFAAAVVAAIALALSAAPASATTWHDGWSYLHFPATEDDGQSVPSRTLDLNGTYRWRVFVAHSAHTDQPRVESRIVPLRGGYEWSDTLFVDEGEKYEPRSQLTNVRTGGKVYQDTYVIGAFGDGSYHWGSTLDRVGPFRPEVGGGAKGIADHAVSIAKQSGSSVFVSSDYRPGSTTTFGPGSDHEFNDASRAARDIAVRGRSCSAGPAPVLDRAAVAIGNYFGRSYTLGAAIEADTFLWNGFRIQIVWRTPKYEGHMCHIHVGVRMD